MGAFNILKKEIQCVHCKNMFIGDIQFKFGDTWQIEYKVGEKIKWGGADIGQPGLKKVKVYGIFFGKCPICGLKLDYEYDIIIEKDRINDIISIVNFEDYKFYDGDYALLE